MKISKEIGESLTFKFASAARKLIKEGKQIISMGLGVPDFKTPKYIFDETKKAMDNGYTNYSAAQGLLELRNLVANDYNNLFNCDINTSEIIITPGAKAALHLSLATILDPNDEIVIFSPYYVSYPALIKIAEPTANIKIIKLNDDYTYNKKRIKDVISEKTKCIIINSPHNPTGHILNRGEIELFVDLCIKFNFYIISDEVYDKLLFSDIETYSLIQEKKIKENLIVVNGFSKSYNMTGWRIGYAIANVNVIKQMTKLQLHINTNTCTFIQKGACAIYNYEENHLKEYLKILEKRMKYFDKKISTMKNINGVIPSAGFFYFVDITSTGLDSNTFCVNLLNQTGIATTPGIAFGMDWDGYVRFSLALPTPELEKAVKKLETFDKTFNEKV